MRPLLSFGSVNLELLRDSGCICLGPSDDAVASNEIAPVKRVTVRRGRESCISMPSANEVMRLIGIHTTKEEKGL